MKRVMIIQVRHNGSKFEPRVKVFCRISNNCSRGSLSVQIVKSEQSPSKTNLGNDLDGFLNKVKCSCIRVHRKNWMTLRDIILLYIFIFCKARNLLDKIIEILLENKTKDTMWDFGEEFFHWYILGKKVPLQKNNGLKCFQIRRVKLHILNNVVFFTYFKITAFLQACRIKLMPSAWRC